MVAGLCKHGNSKMWCHYCGKERLKETETGLIKAPPIEMSCGIEKLDVVRSDFVKFADKINEIIDYLDKLSNHKPL